MKILMLITVDMMIGLTDSMRIKGGIPNIGGGLNNMVMNMRGLMTMKLLRLIMVQGLIYQRVRLP